MLSDGNSMGIKVNIHKDMGKFTLDVKMESNVSRIGILGASGSGKSMTLRSIAGIERIDSGSVELNSRVLYSSDLKIDIQPQRRNVGYMFQNYALFPTMTVEQNIGISLKCNREEKRARIADIISKFNLGGLEKRLPGELSGGQQQRVALARIMIYMPELILLDEPYSALDMYLKDRMQHEMLEMLEGYNGQVIMVSHDRDELYRFSEELFIMKAGKVLTGGNTRDVFAEPCRIEAAKLTGCKNFSDAEVVDPHTINALEWGVILKLTKEIPADTKYVGYRAHYFEPVWGAETANCIKVELSRIDEMPFEQNYYMIPANNAGGHLSWLIQKDVAEQIREKGVPNCLRLNEEHIMLLK